VTAKGKPEPITAFHLIEVDPKASGIARRFDTPLVGRQRELTQLRHAYDRAVDEQACHLFTLLGPAGVGKTRLIAEFVSGLDATVVRGRCLDYGDGITYWPVVEVLKQLGADAAITAIADASSSAHELFLTVRKALEHAAEAHPLVVVFEDIHWGEPTFLDLLDHVADLSRGAPILLLCVARPELLDDRPGWGGGKLNASIALLAPLSAAESVELLDGLGATGIDVEIRSRIVETAAGNPLFVEEMLALALEGGDVRAPSTIQALLQARLDRLAPPERAVIERGAIQGEVFHRGALRELGNGSTNGVDAELVGLVRKELIRPERTTFPGDEGYRFRHLLIRDAAYDALPKETRADLHLRFADWLEAHTELVELDEIVGYHLEQAARYGRELGHPDDTVEQRAARRLAAAGSKAADRDDLPAAANLLTRSLALLRPEDEARAAVVLGRLLVAEQAGEVDLWSQLIAELESSPDPRVRMHGRLARLHLRIHTDPHGFVDEARAVTAEALELFTASRDELGIARVWSLRFLIEWLGSRAEPALASLEKAREHAQRAGASSLAAQMTLPMTGTLLNGPISPEEIRERLDTLRRGAGTVTMAGVLHVEAHLLTLDGHFDEALEKYAEANALVADLGLTMMHAIMAQWPGEVMLQQGRLVESLVIMREAVEQLEQLGDTSFRSTALIRWADVLYQSGDLDEAQRLAIEGEQLGAVEDIVNYAVGRGLRARIAADRGDLDAAEPLARDAMRYAYETDFPRVHGEAHRTLAHVLSAAGRTDEARSELEKATERFESHGNTFEAERTRALLVEL